MAAINFVKGEQYYTAEFQINGPVNVHIERAEAGALYFRQRSIDHGSYDLINGANWNNRGDLTIDTAIQGVVYPMWIKIESASEPTLAEMVEGEQSGGGAGTESTMEYLDISGLESATKIQLLMTAALLVKHSGAIVPLAPLILEIGDSVLPDINYIATDLNVEIALQGNILKLKDTISDSDSIPRITKEQFYNLEA